MKHDHQPYLPRTLDSLVRKHSSKSGDNEQKLSDDWWFNGPENAPDNNPCASVKHPFSVRGWSCSGSEKGKLIKVRPVSVATASTTPRRGIVS